MLPDGAKTDNPTDSNGRYIFRFQIGLDGSATFNEETSKAINAWYYEKATDVVATMREINLRDTFVVEVKDLPPMRRGMFR